jgi:hypothetical protein
LFKHDICFYNKIVLLRGLYLNCGDNNVLVFVMQRDQFIVRQELELCVPSTVRLGLCVLSTVRLVFY